MTATIRRKATRTDVPANRRRGGDLRVLLSPSSVGATSGFLGVGTLAPGEHITEHYHPYSEEFLYVVRGNLEVVLEGSEVHPIAAGDGFFIPIGIRHSVHNRTEVEAEVVFHNSPLAPRPDLGHVDTEAPLHDGPNPQVGGPNALPDQADPTGEQVSEPGA